MIDLHRLNGHPLHLNSDLIRYAEAAPDTTLTLVTGEKFIIRESLDELTTRIVAFRAAVLRTAWPEACGALSTRAALTPPQE